MSEVLNFQASVSQIIRRPTTEVFNAFVVPQIITKFWLSHTTGPLEENKKVTWTFMVPGATVDTTTQKLIPNKLLLLKWSDGSQVEMTFIDHQDYTEVRIKNWGFQGSKEEQLETAIESTQGFTLVLCDLKTLLESGKSHNLVSDKAFLIQQKQNS